MKKFRFLRDVLISLYKHGNASDFTELGVPTVRAVNRRFAGTATRTEIDAGWYELYKFSTYRPRRGDGGVSVRCFFVLLTCLLSVIGCGEGRVGLITDDVVRDAAGCYESLSVSDDAYVITLDKSCVDLELSDFVIARPPVPEGTLPAVRDWVLLATLERDVRQRYWHLFHVQSDVRDPIFRAYLAGRDFLFVLERAQDVGVSQGRGFVRTAPIQFYFHQPEPPLKSASLYYPSAQGWFDHWGPETNGVGVPYDREHSGFVARFSVTVSSADEVFPVELVFGATRDGFFWDTSYQPHIDQAYVLRIFVR